MKILGYETKDWSDIWNLYVHEKNQQPKDLWELRVFWDSMDRESPQGCLKIALKLSECQNEPNDSAKMICRLLTESKP